MKVKRHMHNGKESGPISAHIAKFHGQMYIRVIDSAGFGVLIKPENLKRDEDNDKIFNGPPAFTFDLTSGKVLETPTTKEALLNFLTCGPIDEGLVSEIELMEDVTPRYLTMVED